MGSGERSAACESWLRQRFRRGRSGAEPVSSPQKRWKAKEVDVLSLDGGGAERGGIVEVFFFFSFFFTFPIAKSASEVYHVTYPGKLSFLSYTKR